MAEFRLDSGLRGRGVLVTGAARGIGKATAEAFAAAGARVFAVDRDGTGLRATLGALPGDHLACEYDLANIGGLRALVQSAREQLGDLWALAHVAATLVRQPLEAVREDDWDLQLDVNLKAAFFLSRAAGEVMIADGRGGRIINFSSAGFIKGPMSGSHVYVAAKGGIVGLTRGFARSYGPHGILANTVAPGLIDTPMQRVDNPEDTVAAAVRSAPLGRLGKPEEVAAVVLFLASAHASFVNGATINVSGGAVMY